MVDNAAHNNYLHLFLSHLDSSTIKTLLENVESQGFMVIPDVMGKSNFYFKVSSLEGNH